MSPVRHFLAVPLQNRLHAPRGLRPAAIHHTCRIRLLRRHCICYVNTAHGLLRTHCTWLATYTLRMTCYVPTAHGLLRTHCTWPATYTLHMACYVHTAHGLLRTHCTHSFKRRYRWACFRVVCTTSHASSSNSDRYSHCNYHCNYHSNPHRISHCRPVRQVW